MSVHMSATDTAFSTVQYEDSYPRNIEWQFWHVARHAMILRTLRQVGMADKRLLEIGCGRGIVVAALRAAGLECIGCELASAPIPDDLAQFVFSETDFFSLAADLRASIQGVLLCDVIEHIEDPSAFLHSIIEALPRLSHLLITVPARTELWSRWDDAYGHFRRYDLALIREHVERAGVRLISSRYAFHSLYPGLWFARNRRGDSIAAPPRALWPLHWFIGRMMGVELSVIPRWVPGTSIISVAKVIRQA